jgi:exonuclease III
MNNTNPDYQWVKLEKNHFGFSEDIYICCVYYPPSCSAYTQSLKHDILDCFEKDIIKYQKLGKILLCGDFNARISNTPDYILDDSNQYIPIHSDYLIDKALLQRKYQDQILDARGKDLLDLCISNQLRVLNGRVLGDMFGSYTCHTPNGSSTVDYVFVSESILDQILYFRISNFIPTLSDTHCKLEWELLVKYK